MVGAPQSCTSQPPGLASINLIDGTGSRNSPAFLHTLKIGRPAPGELGLQHPDEKRSIKKTGARTPRFLSASLMI